MVVDPGYGALAKLLFDEHAGFKRVCMVCDDPEDEGLGFTYLASEIRPNAGQSAWIIAIGALLSTGVWVTFAGVAVGPRHRSSRSRQNRSDSGGGRLRDRASRPWFPQRS